MTATVKVATGYLAHEFINKMFEVVATGRAYTWLETHKGIIAFRNDRLEISGRAN